MSHRSTGFTRKQRISAAVLAVALILTMALPAVAAPAGPAALPLIDHFDLAQSLPRVTSGSPTASSSAPAAPVTPPGDTNILGGQRDLSLTFISATEGPLTGASLDIPGVQSSLNISQDTGVKATATIQWDGYQTPPDTATVLDPVGLRAGGATGVDLTQSGQRTAIRIAVTFNDSKVDLTFRVYTDANNWSQRTLQLPGGQTAGATKYYYWLFGDFAQGQGATGGATFTNVGAVELFIDGTVEAGQDLSLHFIELDDGRFDWGDLPETFGTTSSANGPRHKLGTLFLGDVIDAFEINPTTNDGIPSVGADGDDLNNPNPDDEDGVTAIAPWPSGTWNSTDGGAVRVVVTGGPGCLAGWIDWNKGGTFGALDNPLPNSPVATGVNIVPFEVPGAVSGLYYARFRLYEPDGIILVDNVPTAVCTTTRSPLGLAENGEVEDYRLGFNANAVTLSGMSASSAATPLALPLGLVTFLGVLVGGIVLARRPI
jgi:hypothetical protein